MLTHNVDDVACECEMWNMECGKWMQRRNVVDMIRNNIIGVIMIFRRSGSHGNQNRAGGRTCYGAAVRVCGAAIVVGAGCTM